MEVVTARAECGEIHPIAGPYGLVPHVLSEHLQSDVAILVPTRTIPGTWQSLSHCQAEMLFRHDVGGFTPLLTTCFRHREVLGSPWVRTAGATASMAACRRWLDST